MLTVKATKDNCIALKRFYEHRLGAKKRDIPFLMSFAEWEWMWLASGKWHLRGNKGHNYVMARKGPDIGPYAPMNIEFKTSVENRQEAGPQHWSEQSRQRMSQVHTGKPKSAQTRQRMREANLRRNAKPPTRWKPVEVHGVRYESMAAAADAQGIKLPALRKRIQNGWEGHRYL
jgi:hypothetical protein